MRCCDSYVYCLIDVQFPYCLMQMEGKDEAAETDDDFIPIGSCLVYDGDKHIFVVPRPDRRSINVTDSLPADTDVLKLLSEDHVRGFQQLVIAATSTKLAPNELCTDYPLKDPAPLPASTPVFRESSPEIPPPRVKVEKRDYCCFPYQIPDLKSERQIKSESSDLSFSSNSTISDTLPCAWHLGKTYESKSSSSLKMGFIATSQRRTSPKTKHIGRSRKRRGKKRRISENSDTDRANVGRKKFRPKKKDESLGNVLPSRQSERRIQKTLLNNVPQDDDLGVGLGDDANQRRAWHKSRCYPRTILNHKCFGTGKNRKVYFLVQQTSGIQEWLFAAQVDDALKKEYGRISEIEENEKPGETEVPSVERKNNSDHDKLWLEFLRAHGINAADANAD